MSGNGNDAASNGKVAQGNGNDYKVPAGRAEWIVKRKAEAARTGDTNMSQMHFARKGMVTEEMALQVPALTSPVASRRRVWTLAAWALGLGEVVGRLGL